VFIENGAVLRLQHVITEKRLHSHDVRPPVTETEWQNEVSGYGFPGFEGDANDYFRVEIVQDESVKGPARERLRYTNL
jgi:dolichyl-phosphate-mannose-protein mannosyltransferase